MNLSDWKIVFFSVTALLVVTLNAPIIADILPPRQGETFFALALLGENGLADDYYPGEEPIIPPYTPIKWQVYIYNHMGEAQQVKIKIKIADSQTPSPNSTTCTPSQAPEINNLRRALTDNETIIIPFEWMITEINETQDRIGITKIQINEQTITANITTRSNESLRMIFELWTYDKASRDFTFGWSEQEETQCVWNQIFFEIYP